MERIEYYREVLDPSSRKPARGGSWKLRAGGATVALLLALSGVSGMAQVVRLSDTCAETRQAPTLDWRELADSAGGYAVELSTDEFATTVYSSSEATGRAVVQKAYKIPAQVWGHIAADGATVHWRVLSLDAAGQETARSAAAVINGGAAGTKGKGRKSPGAALSRAAKLAKVKPEQTHLPDEFLVQVSEAREEELRSALADVGAPIERVRTEQGRLLVRFVTEPGGDAAQAAIRGRKKLGQRSGGLYDRQGKPTRTAKADDVIIQPNFIYRAHLAPTDPYHDAGPRVQQWPRQVNAVDAWSADITGSGVTVAVLDTGVNVYSSVHQEFDGAGKLIVGPDFINKDGDPADDNGHGTHVAGIAVAEADGLGIVGIAPEAALMPIKVLGAGGSGSSVEVAQGVDYAVANGARVVNMSLGTSAFAALPGVAGIDLLTESCIRNASDRGVVVVTSAGNDHASLPKTPSDLSDAINVGAVTSADVLTEFSNYGPWLSVVAPGYDQYSALNSDPTGYTFKQGTSQAAPVVAGVAALILSKHPALTARQVKEMIQNGTEDLGLAGRDEFYGYGRVNAARSLGVEQGDTVLPALVNVEFSSNQIVATFSREMLSGAGANSVENSANWNTFGTGMSGFLASATTSYSGKKLTITGNGVNQLGGFSHQFRFLGNCTDTTGKPLACSDLTGIGRAGRQNILGNSLPSLSSTQAYGSAVAYDDGTMKILFRFPVTEASAENAENYTLESNPTNTTGGDSTGGTAVSLAGAAFSYDAATQVVTISNLPSGAMTTAGNTFAVTLGSGIQNADVGNGIYTSLLDPIYGCVQKGAETPLALTEVDNSLLGNNFSEVLRLTFNRAVRTDEAFFSPSNYSVTVNGGQISNPSDMAVMYNGGSNEVILTGFNFVFNHGQSVSVTVSNLRAEESGAGILPANATATGTLDLVNSNFTPQYSNVVAGPDSVFAQFTYYTKMDEESVLNPANWALYSDATNPPTTAVSLAGASFHYDSEQNALTIANLPPLTSGNYFRLAASSSVTKRNLTFLSLSSLEFTDVVGGGSVSPVNPADASVKAGGSAGNSNEANQVNQSNRSNVQVAVQVPAGAAAGQVVHVSLIDSSSPAKVASGSLPLTVGGAQTVTVSGIDASALSFGSLLVQTALLDSDSIGSSDVIRGTTAIHDSTVPVAISAFSAE